MKNTETIVLKLSTAMIEAVDSNSSNRSAFIRDAIADKLARDCGIELPAKDFRISRGTRTDLSNPSPEKLAFMREQAAHARKFAHKKPPE